MNRTRSQTRLRRPDERTVDAMDLRELTAQAQNALGAALLTGSAVEKEPRQNSNPSDCPIKLLF